MNFVFDPAVPGPDDHPRPARRRLRAGALAPSAASASTFHRVIDAHVVTVIPDTPTKRREYEQQVVKTFFLSNADLKETIDLLRVVLGARRVAPLPGANALTINDTPDKVAAAERIVDIVDKRRAEVVVEVEILEVNRGRLKDYGIEITSGVAGHRRASRAAIFPDPTNGPRPSTTTPTRRTTWWSRACPASSTACCRRDTSTRLLANPQLRTSEGQTAQARFGDQVPVPVTTFSPIAHGRRHPAADHVVRVQERGRQHRHHAAGAPRRRGHAAPQARHLAGGTAGLPGPAHLQQPHRHQRDPAARTARPTSWPASSATPSARASPASRASPACPFLGRLFARNQDRGRRRPTS